MSRVDFGVLAMGVFVGYLLGLALLQTRSLNIKAAITVVGAALSGAPVVFMNGLGDSRWIYPVGLLLGLLFVRIPGARRAIAHKWVTNRPDEKALGWFAWFDIAVITLASLAALAYALLIPSGVAKK